MKSDCSGRVVGESIVDGILSQATAGRESGTLIGFAPQKIEEASHAQA
jgi:hypothetical protein